MLSITSSCYVVACKCLRPAASLAVSLEPAAHGGQEEVPEAAEAEAEGQQRQTWDN